MRNIGRALYITNPEIGDIRLPSPGVTPISSRMFGFLRCDFSLAKLDIWYGTQ
jgi:hypothetical protein